MGRRKKVIIEDDGDSSDGGRPGDEGEGFDNPDLAEEAALFANPYGRKRPRTKEDSIYGSFMDTEDAFETKRGSKYLSGVSFVSGTKQPPKADDDGEGSDESEEVDDGNGAEPMDIDDDADAARPGLGARAKIEEVDERPSSGRGAFGLGFGSGSESPAGTNTPPETAHTGFGFNPIGRGGLGLGATPEMPTAFGKQKPKDAKARERGKPLEKPSSGRDSPLQAVDKAFGKFDTKGVASRMMEKMGWKKGMGLGKEGEGISAPIDVKLRPNRAGLGMVDERTEALKREQKSREFEQQLSEEVTVEKVEPRTGQWKQSIGKKKAAFKSAQELIAEQADAPITTGSAIKATKILDMTGREVRELAHVSEAATANAAFEVTAARLPELRHNVRLLADLAQQDLLHIGRQMRIETTRQEQLRVQQDKISKKVEEEQKRVVHLKAVVELANECQVLSQKFMHSLQEINLDALLIAFSPPFQKLQHEYFEEYQRYKLDELVIASLAPVMKRLLARWEPLTDPTYASDVFRQWKRLLMIASQADTKRTANGYPEESREMTPYESMMYNVWLPKIRQAINNDWDPKQPDAAISLLESWYAPTPKESHAIGEDPDNDPSKLLPSWLYHNILEQLILPKLLRRVEQWNPSQDPIPIYTWIHPWLPHLADRMEGVFTTIRHKFHVGWRERKWVPSDPTALETLMPWREVFKSSDMDSLVIKAILPKLVETLQNDFNINPAAQDLAPLQNVLAWSELVPTHLLVHLLETEFFPKWHNVLWTWLSSAEASLDEVAMWYQSWKTRVFSPELVKEPGMANQFRAGLDMMNRSIAMGGARGPMPAMPLPIAQLSETAAAGGKVGSGARRPAAGVSLSAADTFKDYVERMASERDLLFAPANRVHPTSGRALFRLAPAAKAASGSGGVVGYIEEGVLFVEDAQAGWKPVGVDEAMDLAAKQRARAGPSFT
ncbi:hypothetical protein PhCBS80983_g05426 [Powellomyces hirtus]|uniref:G-patch domain-containing protein n=1 Tax=Powellomyces hirtus TaxID=109895 RepID=A0A507DUS7_9FUNG|nr:hypothetical protein PhCBS80983_g05426 [Powellomyces hirtus]